MPAAARAAAYSAARRQCARRAHAAGRAPTRSWRPAAGTDAPRGVAAAAAAAPPGGPPPAGRPPQAPRRAPARAPRGPSRAASRRRSGTCPLHGIAAAWAAA
eukprot:361251-Chlamydomonas_euryale.AAC.2